MRSRRSSAPVALAPDDATTLFNLGFVLQKAGRHEEAIARMAARVELNPALDRAWYGLGISLIHCGRFHEAIERLTEAARLQPFNPFARYQLAAAWFKLGEPEKVRAEYRKLKTFDPEDRRPRAHRLRRAEGSPTRSTGLASCARTAASSRSPTSTSSGRTQNTIASQIHAPARTATNGMWPSSTRRGVIQRARADDRVGDDAQHLVEDVVLALAAGEHVQQRRGRAGTCRPARPAP